MTNQTDRLIASTRRRSFATTLALLVLLVVGIGAATAVVGLQALDSDVDRSLRSSVAAAVAGLAGELPQAGESSSGESDETIPAAADTFVIVLDRAGAVVSNPSRLQLIGLPDRTALPAAARGEDIRTVSADGLAIRLITMPVVRDGVIVGFVQGGFVLSLHDRQSASLVLTVAIVGAAGLLGAALVTLYVTGRSLVPIRRTFEAQRRFVADASHELRTPAALIRANAEVLDREALVTGEGQSLLQDIVSEADRLAALVEELLALAAWDATGLSLERRPVDIAELVRDTVREAGALAAQHGVALRAAAPGPTVAQVDRTRFIQLILILLDNAIDHAPAGTTVTVTAHDRNGRAELTVDDEGPGVPAGEREVIFEPFASGTGRGRHRGRGTGLGLAIARRIAIAHGATIGVDPTGAGGSRFIVSLPSRSARG